MNSFYIKATYSSNTVSQHLLQRFLKSIASQRKIPYNILEKGSFNNVESPLSLKDATLSSIYFTETSFFEDNITYILSIGTNSIIKKFIYNNNLKQAYLLDTYMFYASYEVLLKNINALLFLQDLESLYSKSFLKFDQYMIQNSVINCLQKQNTSKIIRNDFFRILNFIQWIDRSNQTINNQSLTINPWLNFDYSKENFSYPK